MSTITKERVANLLQFNSEGSDCQANAEQWEVHELARTALASLEAEPAIHRWRRVTVEPYGPYPWHYGDFIGFSKPVDGIEDEYYYSAPPAPVSVPDLKPVGFLFVSDDGAVAYSPADWPMKGFNLIGQIYGDVNACRAAMLQGVDGALTNEDTKRVDELVMWIKRLAHSLRKSNPDSKLQSDAMDYLSRKGLVGVKDILR